MHRILSGKIFKVTDKCRLCNSKVRGGAASTDDGVEKPDRANGES